MHSSLFVFWGSKFYKAKNDWVAGNDHCLLYSSLIYPHLLYTKLPNWVLQVEWETYERQNAERHDNIAMCLMLYLFFQNLPTT